MGVNGGAAKQGSTLEGAAVGEHRQATQQGFQGSS
jgi:hypothetical protein